MNKATLHFQIDREWADRKKGLARTYPEIVKLGIMCAEKIKAKAGVDTKDAVETEFNSIFK